MIDGGPLTQATATKTLCVHIDQTLSWNVHVENRTFYKMAVENSNKTKLKTYTSTRKNTFTLAVTLQSFSISGVISAEKMYDWGYRIYPQSYKRL